jgi:hypothetical protein
VVCSCVVDLPRQQAGRRAGGQADRWPLAGETSRMNVYAERVEVNLTLDSPLGVSQHAHDVDVLLVASGMACVLQQRVGASGRHSAFLASLPTMMRRTCLALPAGVLCVACDGWFAAFTAGCTLGMLCVACCAWRAAIRLGFVVVAWCAAEVVISTASASSLGPPDIS